MGRVGATWLLVFVLLGCGREQASTAESGPGEDEIRNAVLLIDTLRTRARARDSLREVLESDGYRVLLSPTTGEEVGETVARLPWLLQPGVGVIVYDGDTAALRPHLPTYVRLLRN